MLVHQAKRLGEVFGYLCIRCEKVYDQMDDILAKWGFRHLVPKSDYSFQESWHTYSLDEPTSPNN